MKQITRAMAEAEGIKVFSEYEVESIYDDFLDEQGDITVFGLKYNPSYVLKEVDPTIYRCGLLDFCNGLYEEIDDGWISASDYELLCDKLEEEDEA